jgi:hypothetical protein
LIDGHSGGNFSMSLATFGALGFTLLVIGWREVPIVDVNSNNLVHI